MTPDRWQQIRHLYEILSGMESAERSAFLDRTCSENDSLRRELESLLIAQEEIGNFMTGSALEQTAQQLGARVPVWMAGARLDHYQLLSLIGAGGMGEVYEAKDTRLGSKVAIKLVSASVSTDPERRRRFEQEARAIGMLNHPNILTIYDIGEHEGVPYLVLELLEGWTLREWIKSGMITPAKALGFAFQIIGGLAAAHKCGISHCDLKPENIFITRDGRLKILDFGLAKLRRPRLDSGDLNEPASSSIHTNPGMI